MTFDACLAVTLREEGGYSCNNADPGGATNHGVTLHSWESWTKKPATPADIKALTVADVTPFYRATFWQPLNCDQLGPALGLCVFDFAVNAGASRAARHLQILVGQQRDGVIGPATIKALQAYITSHGLPATVAAYQADRAAYYRVLPTFSTFGGGWLARVKRVTAESLAMGKK
jgi:lysozyme family protein